MKKFLFMLLACLSLMLGVTSCHGVCPDADEEAVLIYKPWFFGHGGVDKDAVTTGLTWCWWSTSSEYFKTVPVRYDVNFDDIMSDGNTPLDYETYIILQINKGKSPILLQNYGVDWFRANIETVYRNFVIEEVSKYSPFDLMSNREVCNQMQKDIKVKLDNHIHTLSNSAEFPVICREVVTGRAHPNHEQLQEMNKTAAAIQARQTQEREEEMQQAREKAEAARAMADQAYMRKMNLTADQFITLKLIEKSNPNVDVMLGAGTSPIWNVRR